MKVKLNQEWLGHAAGSVVTVSNSMGNRLIHNQSASAMVNEKLEVEPEVELETELGESAMKKKSEGEKGKMTGIKPEKKQEVQPAKDKMVEGAINK